MTFSINTPTRTDPPKDGTYWRHHNGGLYVVLGTSNLYADEAHKDKYQPRVFYRGAANGRLWDKLLSEWYDKMTPEASPGLSTDPAPFQGDYDRHL